MAYTFRYWFQYQYIKEIWIWVVANWLKTHTSTDLFPTSNTEQSNSVETSDQSDVIPPHLSDVFERCSTLLMLAYRSSVHESTGVSPCAMMFGRQVNLPIDLVMGRPTIPINHHFLITGKTSLLGNPCCFSLHPNGPANCAPIHHGYSDTVQTAGDIWWATILVSPSNVVVVAKRCPGSQKRGNTHVEFRIPHSTFYTGSQVYLAMMPW